jgi:hypothetical protein
MNGSRGPQIAQIHSVLITKTGTQEPFALAFLKLARRLNPLGRRGDLFRLSRKSLSSIPAFLLS